MAGGARPPKVAQKLRIELALHNTACCWAQSRATVLIAQGRIPSFFFFFFFFFFGVTTLFLRNGGLVDVLPAPPWTRASLDMRRRRRRKKNKDKVARRESVCTFVMFLFIIIIILSFSTRSNNSVHTHTHRCQVASSLSHSNQFNAAAYAAAGEQSIHPSIHPSIHRIGRGRHSHHPSRGDAAGVQ
jgi:hypothetical protein